MAIFLGVLAVLILVALIYLASIPGDYEIRVSRVLPASPDQVFDRIIDLESWSEWSPWLMHEPDCPLSFQGNIKEVGGSYSWDGKYIGAGTLEHSLLERPNRAEHKLSFTRPFKAVCGVGFELEAEEQGTKVTWSMNGSMPFLFRPMIRRTKEMISQDYEIGLAMLGGLLAPQSEHPRFEFLGNQEREVTHYLSKSWQGHLDDMPEAMSQGFDEIDSYVKASDIEPIGQPFSVYTKVKKRGTYFEVDMAIPVAEGTTDDKYEIKQVPGGLYNQTQLQGSYGFLKGAWYSAMCHLKMTKIKFDWKRPCVELYENDPKQAEHSNQIVTSIFIPIK